MGGFGSGGMGGYGGGLLPGLLTVAPLGTSTLVVAEPGTDPKGTAGLWLTVYRLEGIQLKRVSTTFHRSGGAGGTGASAPAAGSGGGRGGIGRRY